METYTLRSPVYIILGKKTKNKIPMNLNNYRNLHHHQSDDAKKQYKFVMTVQINRLPKMKKVSLLFVLHRGTRAKGDRHNVCSIVQKFFCDALVELGKLPSDTDEHVLWEKYETGDVSPKKPYCEIIINHIE